MKKVVVGNLAVFVIFVYVMFAILCCCCDLLFAAVAT